MAEDMMKKIIYGLLAFFALLSCEDDRTTEHITKIYFKNEGIFEIEPTDTLELVPKILYDHKSRYSWKVDGVEVCDTLKYQFIPKTMKDYTLSFSVQNSNGADTSSIFIIVRELVDFQEMDNVTYKSKAQQLIMHSDDISEKPEGENAEETAEAVYEEYLSSRGHRFSNKYVSDTVFWGGFAFSSRTDVQNLATEESIGCAFITQKQSSAQYLVATNAFDGPYVEFKEKYIVRSLDISNDNYCTVLSKFGIENIISEFKHKDYFKVRIYGVVDNKTKTLTSKYVEHTLIDCDFDGPAMYFRQNEWETLDLRELGMVEGLYLDLMTSAKEFPLLCCIDNIKLQKE